MGDETQVTRKEFEEFKNEFADKLNKVIKTVDEHIISQERRHTEILSFLNSPEYLALKIKLGKA